MDRKKLAAKVKADLLEGTRAYTALIELNDLDEDNPTLEHFRLLLRRLAVNREYAFAVRGQEGEAPKESLRVRADSHRVFKHLRQGVRRYAEGNGLERLYGPFNIDKRGPFSRIRVIPPVFVEDGHVVVQVLRDDGWVMPPTDLLDL